MTKENVVISGIGGSFPKCGDLEEFMAALYDKTNLMTEMGRDWTGPLKISPHLGRSKDFNDFDNSFLSVNYKLSVSMDKSCKAFLKQSYACLLDSGYSPVEMQGRDIGCFMHSTISDQEMNIGKVFHQKFPGLVGIARTMYANRVGWYFDLHGTSISHHGPNDGAFSTLKMAYDAVVAGNCESAFVGVTSLCVDSLVSLEYQGLGLLTDESVSKPLAEDANGYLRADATVVLFIQRESDARRSYAQLFHIGSCFYGDRLGTFQSREEKNMIKLLEDTYRECGLKPSDISYLETGSWANKELDTQELKLIRKVFTAGRDKPLMIGSVVGNTGFTEGASGFVALVKCILALRTGVIAPTLHVDKPNAAVDDKLKIVTKNTRLDKDYLAVNSFGLSGNLAHVIIKKSNVKTGPKYPIQDDLPRLYFIASRSIDYAEKVLQKLDSTQRSKYLSSIMNSVFGKQIRMLMARSYAIYPFKNEPIQHSKQLQSDKRPVWFLFSGMGSQWQAMGKDLMKFPVFANSISKSAVVLKEMNIDLINILTNQEDATIFDNILNSFVGIASIQIALVDMLYAMNIKPDGMIGHSVGELGCAYADGSVTAEQTIYLAYARGKASLEASLIPGMMAAIGYGQSQVKPLLPADIDVACHNSSSSCTLSGPTESVMKFVDILVNKGVFAKAVNVSNIAYHSRYIKPVAPLLLTTLKKILPQPKERSSKWISTSIEENNWNSDLAKYASAEYFTNNLLSSVYFEEGAHHIPKNAILIEIAPHGLLQAIVKKSLDMDTVHIPLTNRSQSVDNIEYFLKAVGDLYLNGCEPDVNAIYPPIEYPIPSSVPSISQFVTWDNSINTSSMDDAKMSWKNEVLLGICAKPEHLHILTYKINEQNVIPPAFYIEIVLDFLMAKKPDASFIEITDFRVFDYNIRSFCKQQIRITLSIANVTGTFELVSEGEKHLTVLATGVIKEADEKILITPEWKTKIGKLQVDTYLKIMKYSVPHDLCLDYLTKYLEGLSGEIVSNGRIFDLIDCSLKIAVIDKSEYKKPEVPYHINEIIFSVDGINEYKNGKSVQVYYEPTTNSIVSSAMIMKKIKTKPFLSDDLVASEEYTGPISYLTSMKSTYLKNIDVNFLGLASQLSATETIVDYSGVTSSGHNIMGIISYVNSMIHFEKQYMWKVPTHWSLEEAVTVPLVYSMAYMFLIKEKSCYRTEKMKSVFIQCGDTALGEACIALALYMKKKVFTTVSSDEGKNTLLRRFPELSSANIFLNSVYDYSLRIMLQTEGKGVDVIVNTLEAGIHMNLCWESLNMNGELIQVGVEDTQSLYMFKFLNSQSFISVKTEILLKLDGTAKTSIQNFMNEGISNGVIKPIVSKTQKYAQYQEVENISYQVISLKSKQRFSSVILDVNPNSSYGIIGGKDAHLIVEWLMQRGARKIVLEFSNEFRASRMSPVLEKYGDVLTLSRSNTSTISGTEAFLNDVRSFGDVAAIFALSLTGVDCKTKLDNIKQICDSQKGAIFLTSLLCSEPSGWHFELKADGIKTISRIIPSLDESLKSRVKYTTSFDFEGKNYIKNGKSDVSIDSQHLLDAHLPQNLTELYDDHKELSQIKASCFIEQKSLFINFHSRSLMPLFCFSAISSTNMKKIIRGLYYHSFLAHIPIGCSMSDIVSDLYKNLKEIQPSGIYTLVSESWSGIYAIKLAEYLEKKGDKVTVVLLDASPYLMREIVQQNKDVFTKEQDLATYIMQKQGSICTDGQKRASLELSCKSIMDTVKHHLDTEVNYKLKIPCFLVTSDHFVTNMEHYKMFEFISDVYVTSIISPYKFSDDKDVVQFINNNVAITWW